MTVRLGVPSRLTAAPSDGRGGLGSHTSDEGERRYFWFEPTTAGWEVYRAHPRDDIAWDTDHHETLEVEVDGVVYEVATVLRGPDGQPLTDAQGEPVSARVAASEDLTELLTAFAIDVSADKLLNSTPIKEQA